MSTERQTASTLEDIHWAHKERYHFAAKFMQPTDRVVDIGCGCGYGSFMLADKVSKVVGIDIAEEAITQAKKDYPKPNIEYIQHDCNSGIIIAEPFEWAVAFEVIEHVDDPLPMLKGIYQMLIDGGRIICSTPNELIVPFEMVDNPWHKKHYTPWDLANLIVDAGFKFDSMYMQHQEGFYLTSPLTVGSDIVLAVGVKQ